MNLEERVEVALVAWPDEAEKITRDLAWKLYRAACIHDIANGWPTPTVSRAERERAEGEIAKREKAVTP